MAHWELKIEKQFADEIVSGMKNFEIRCESDKVFQKGDSVEFLVNPVELYAAGESGACYVTKEDHPITGRIYDITYVLHGWGLREDYCAFAIKERVNEETPGGVIRPKPDYEPEAEMIKRLNPEADRLLETIILTELKERRERRENCEGCLYHKAEAKNGCRFSGYTPVEWLI